MAAASVATAAAAQIAAVRHSRRPRLVNTVWEDCAVLAARFSSDAVGLEMVNTTTRREFVARNRVRFRRSEAGTVQTLWLGPFGQDQLDVVRDVVPRWIVDGDGSITVTARILVTADTGDTTLVDVSFKRDDDTVNVNVTGARPLR
jgi:hypothetical protein